MVNKIWSSEHQRRYDSLYRYLKDVKKYKNIKPETYITTHKKYLLSAIRTNKNWSPSTVESYLFMVARFLELKGDEDWKNFASVAHSIMVARKQQDAESELDEQEQQSFKELDYFKTFFE